MTQETFEQMVERVAHRSATQYKHTAEMGLPKYLFSGPHLIDFAARLREELENGQEPVGRYYWENVADATFLAVPSETTPHYMKDDFPLYTHPFVAAPADAVVKDAGEFWGASTLAELEAALDFAHELSGPPHLELCESAATIFELTGYPAMATWARGIQPAVMAMLERELAKLRLLMRWRKDAEMLDWIAIHGSFGVDSTTGEIGGDGKKRVAATRAEIHAAMQGKERGKWLT